MNKCVLLLGGNLGDVQNNFAQANDKIKNRIGTLAQQSALYRSEPWGFEASDLFLNQVIVVKTQLSPFEVLDETQKIESEIGRKEKTQGQAYSSRLIDIDILFFDSLVLQQERLEIPHPRLHLRNFTLQPLAEIIPNFRHPVLKKTVTELLEQSPDNSICKKVIS